MHGLTGEWRTTSGRTLDDFSGICDGHHTPTVSELVAHGARPSKEAWERHQRWIRAAYPRLTLRLVPRVAPARPPPVAALRRRSRSRSRGSSLEDADVTESSMAVPGGWWLLAAARLLPGVAMAVAVVVFSAAGGFAQLATVVVAHLVLVLLSVTVLCCCANRPRHHHHDAAGHASMVLAPPSCALVTSSVGFLAHSGLHMVFTTSSIPSSVQQVCARARVCCLLCVVWFVVCCVLFVVCVVCVVCVLCSCLAALWTPSNPTCGVTRRFAADG